MLNEAASVVVLLTERYHNRLLVVALKGGDSNDVMMTDGGAMVVEPGVAVTGLHCIETGEDLRLDEEYAVFHTGQPQDFVTRFVPVLRTAVAQLGWPQVRTSLRAYLAKRGNEASDEA